MRQDGLRAFAEEIAIANKAVRVVVRVVDKVVRTRVVVLKA